MLSGCRIFLNSGNIQFTCTLCVEHKQATRNSITDACQNNTKDIPRLLTDVIKQVDEPMKSQQMFTVCDALLSNHSESSSLFSSTTVPPLSYAAIVSKSISYTIKQAVTETIKNRKKLYSSQIFFYVIWFSR